MSKDKRHHKTLFLSDIHLGTRGCQADALLDFLDHNTCDHLYLVGDIIDGWRLKSSVYWPASHSEVLRKFLGMAKAGTRVTFVSGNHDEFLREFTDLTFEQISLVDEAEHTSASGEKLLVIHGDQFDVVTRYHRWIALLGDVGYTLLLLINRWINIVRRRYGFCHWSLSAWVKHRVKQAVNFIGQFEVSVAHHCRMRGYDGIVCGHIHHAEIRPIEDISYLNCGDWVESLTAIVEDELGRFSILRWQDEAVQVGNVVSLRKPEVAADTGLPERAA